MQSGNSLQSANNKEESCSFCEGENIDNEHQGKTSSTRNDEKPVRIALFTVMGKFALETALRTINEREDTTLACVVTCSGPKSRRSDAHVDTVQALWETHHPNVDVIVSNKKSKYADLMALYEVDLVLCVGFPWLLPPSLVSSPRIRFGVINLHNSPLPRRRGPNSFGWQIRDGAKAISYTIHRMDRAFDTGPILVQYAVPIDVNESVQEHLDRRTEPHRAAMDKAITMVLAGVEGEPQVGDSSEAPFFDDSYRWIDFSSTALSVHNKIRAHWGSRDLPKGALATVEGRTICITKSWIHPTDTGAQGECINPNAPSAIHADDEAAKPGMVLQRNEEEHFVVQCGDTTLEVLEWNFV